LIDFRYHIVSLVAVFLALTLGILLGSSVIQGAVIDALEADIKRYREERDEARAELREVREEQRSVTGLVRDEIAPWTLDGRLEGARILYVTDGQQMPAWAAHVEKAMGAAGGRSAGTIAMPPSRWDLGTPEEQEDLTRAVEASGLEFVPGTDPAGAALELLGENLLGQQGGALIDALEDAGFLSADPRGDGAWPPPSSMIVVLSSSRRAEATAIPGAVRFATALAAGAPTLVATDRPQGRSLVTQVRQLSGDERPEGSLSTFDSATDEDDPGGLGVVSALVAASEGRASDLGAEGEAFIAPPSPQE
jgi:hypothetical protein